MYKHAHYKRLSKKMSERAKRGWHVRRLRMQANPREETFEEIVEQAKQDRKGSFYGTMEREGLKLALYHSLNRSDQFDVTVVRASRFEGVPPIESHVPNLSLPKVLKLFSENL